MDNLTTVAVSKAIEAKALKAARAGLEPGTYAVDALVHVKGGVKVGEDYDQALTNKVKPVDLWLATLDLLAPQVTESLVARIIERALDGSDESLRRFADLKERTGHALDAVRNVTRSTCKGKVTVTLTAETVEPEVTVTVPESILIIP